MKLWTNKLTKKTQWRLRVKDTFFRIFKLRRIIKVIRKRVKERITETRDYSLTQTSIYASKFKMSIKQIEYGLNILIQKKQLLRFEILNLNDKECIKIFFPDGIFSICNSDDPREVDLDSLELEQVNAVTESKEESTIGEIVNKPFDD